MDLIASVNSTDSFAKTLGQYGPYALLAFFLLVGLGVAARQVNKAPAMNRSLFRRLFIFEWGLVVALMVFAMFVWYRVNVSPIYVMTGTIENLDPHETIYSDDLFLRTIAAEGDFTIYEWKVIKERKLADGEKVDFMVRSSGSAAMPPHQLIVVKSAFYEPNARVRIKWRKSDLRAVYLDTDEPLPQSGAAIAARPRLAEGPPLFHLPSVWAQGRPIPYQQVQSKAGASNPIVREAEIRSLALDGTKSIDSIKKLLGESDALVSSTAIYALNAMTPEVRNQIRGGHLLKEAVRPVVIALGSPDSAVRQEALRCINWYDPSAVLPVARDLIKSKLPADRALAGSILETYGREDALPLLKQAEMAEKDVQALVRIKSAGTAVQNLRAVSRQREELGASGSPKLKAALDLALQLRDKKIPFKWGGKSEKEGFDSPAFAAYVLARAGVLSNPDKYWSGPLRQKFPPVSTPSPGDLVFYDSGYVMIFLGNQTCIGMTASGILMVPVGFGPKLLGYGKVNY